MQTKITQNYQHIAEILVKRQKKFKDYLQQKLQKIQQTKCKTIKLTEKYFSDIKQKMDKYMMKEQKRILNSYEDNINMSINCINHNYLYSFEKQNHRLQIKAKMLENTRKISIEEFQNELQERNRKSSYEDHNQLSIKLQIKALMEQMIIAQSHISEKGKLITQSLKLQLQKLLSPLVQLFYKIPKLTKNHEHSSPVLIKQSSKKGTQGNTSSQLKKRKRDSNNNKGYSQTMNNQRQMIEKDRTQKLLQKLSQENENSSTFKSNFNKIIKIQQLSPKQDQILSKVNKCGINTKIIDFDMLNNKSPLYICQKTIQQPQFQNNQPHNDIQNQNQVRAILEQNNQTYEYKIFLNEKQLIKQQSQNEYIFQRYGKLQFQSKPNRFYLIIFTSKIIPVPMNQNQEQRKNKIYQLSIYNYKGQIMTKSIITKFNTLVEEKIVSIFQMDSLKEFFFVVFNNQVKRFSLKNILERKTFFIERDQKIINATMSQYNIILFGGRRMQLYLISHQLDLLQVFNWTAMYPSQVSLHNFFAFNLKTNNQIKNQLDQLSELDTFQIQRSITFIIPKQTIGSLYYLQNGFISTLEIQQIKILNNSNQISPTLEVIKEIIQIQNGIYILISTRKNQFKPKTDLFLLEIAVSLDTTIKGKIYFVQTINQTVLKAKFIKNKLYLQYKNGKIIPYDLC